MAVGGLDYGVLEFSKIGVDNFEEMWEFGCSFYRNIFGSEIVRFFYLEQKCCRIKYSVLCTDDIILFSSGQYERRSPENVPDFFELTLLKCEIGRN